MQARLCNGLLRSSWRGTFIYENGLRYLISDVDMSVDNRQFVGAILVAAFVAHVALFAPAPLLLQTAAVLVLVTLLPGILLVESLVGRTPHPPERGEYLLYAVGAGVSILILLMLGINYFPGALSRWQLLLVVDVLLGLLLVLTQLHQKRSSNAKPASNDVARRRQTWLLIGLLFVLLVGGFFRFVNLDYSEFQGDEARAMLRAAAVVQGYDDVLFLHKKGPAEILVPAALYVFTGRITESAARLPFALINLASVFAVFVLGRRMFGAVAGWIAAMLLALNGYYIAFGRIVQYESIGFLASPLLVLVCYRLVQHPHLIARYLVLAGLFLTAGLMAHYDMMLAVPPAIYLVLQLRHRLHAHTLVRGLLPAFSVTMAALAAFYLPYMFNPRFGSTSDYLAEQLGVDGIPYNNFPELFWQALLYMSSYYLILVVALAILALVYAYWRGLSRRWRLPLAGLVLAGSVVALLRPEASPVAGIDASAAFFLVVIPGVIVLPRLSIAERTTWLWFGISMVIAVFAVARPGTHHMPFHAPWALLGGYVTAAGWQWLQSHVDRRSALLAGVGLATVAVAVFGWYLYQVFIYNRVEVVETWEQNRPRGYWTPSEELRAGLEFGLPHRSGWKAIGVLYQDGRLDGFFRTNAQEWLADWYVRGVKRCERDTTYLFIDLRKTVSDNLREQQERGAYTHIGTILVYGEPRLEIYQRDAPSETPWTYDVAAMEPRFDAQLSTPFLSLGAPAVYPAIESQARYRLGDRIWLDGYELETRRVHPGDTLDLTLYWRVAGDVDTRYTVFNQVIEQDVAIYGQRDREPGCDGAPTSDWERGQEIADRYRIPIRPDAKPGVYPLLTGMYQSQTGERLQVFNQQGEPIGSAVEVATIEIEPPR